jgi:MFS family permease
MLFFETLLPRIFAVYVGPNFVYFLISIALVGLSSGGILATFLGDRFAARPRTHIARFALIFAILIFVCAALLSVFGTALNHSLDARYAAALPHGDRSQAIPPGIILVPSMSFALGAGLVTALPFLCIGLCLSLAFKFASREIGRVYAYDLVGAGLGCVCTVAALTWMRATDSMILVSFFAAVGAICLAWDNRSEDRKTLNMTFAAFLVLGSLFSWATFKAPIFRYSIHNYSHLRSYLDGPITEGPVKWTPIGRISLLDRMWSPPLNEIPRVRPKHFVGMDLGGHSVIEDFTPENLEAIKKTSVFSDDVPEPIVIPGLIRPNLRDYLVLMAGNGQDMMRAYAWYGDKIHLQGVELNPVVYELGFLYNPARLDEFFRLPNVKMHIGEGREFVESSNQKFDVIVLSYSGATFATGTGSLASTPQFLFTKEAFITYLQKLKEDGALVIAGGFDNEDLPNSLKTFVAAHENLRPQRDPRQHVLFYRRLGTGDHEHYGIFYLNPLSRQDVARAESELAKLNLEVSYSAYSKPKYSAVSDFFEDERLLPLRDQNPLWKFHPLAGDRIHTDDQPFFYFDLIWGSTGGFLVIGYILTAAGAFVIAVFFLLAPIVLARKKIAGAVPVRWRFFTAFICLGAGFILIEVGSIQKFELFLGHPQLTLVVILSLLLIFTGIGSFFSGRWYESGILTIRRAASCLVLYGVAMLLFLNYVIYELTARPLALRIVVIAAVLLPLGLLLGSFFPELLRRMTPAHDSYIPLAWGLNGIFSVVGDNLGTLVYLFFGSSWVVILGLLCYFALAAATYFFAWKPEAVTSTGTA